MIVRITRTGVATVRYIVKLAKLFTVRQCCRPTTVRGCMTRSIAATSPSRPSVRTALLAVCLALAA
ncbi:MAG: hypothetical protein AB7I04_14560, partial [Pseudomonadales bacterium]